MGGPLNRRNASVRRRVSRRAMLKRAAQFGMAVPALSLLEGYAEGRTPARAQGGTVEISWYVGKDVTDANKTLVETFNARQSRIRVNWQEQPPSTSDQHDKYVSILAAKDPGIDVFALDIPFVPEFASAQWLTPLDDSFDRAELEKTFFRGPLRGANYGGHLWAMPWFNNAAVLFYRKDLLDAAGLRPPATYSELVHIATKLRAPDMEAGFTWQGAQYEGGVVDFFEYLWGFGGEFFGDKGEVIVDRAPGERALQFMVDLINTYKVTPSAVTTWKETESRNVFVQGKAVCERNWIGDYAIANSQGSKIIGKVGLTPLPAAPGRKGQSVLGTWNLAISRFSRHRNEAAEFIRFMTAAEAMKVNYQRAGRIPPRRAVFDDPDIRKQYPYIDALKPVFEQARPRPLRPDYSQISAEAIQPNLAAALTKQKPVPAALKDMASAAARIAKTSR
jgi:multiple sugar transport system substrate-binding protein